MTLKKIISMILVYSMILIFVTGCDKGAEQHQNSIYNVDGDYKTVTDSEWNTYVDSEKQTDKVIEHNCEVDGCDKEGIKSIYGLSGDLEYYCIDHYSEMESIIEGMEEDVYSSSSTFTNKYGTSTTKCAHSGCNNYIASSGDTNCCIEHSNRCGECGCYIDEDAMYCISCLEQALTP